MGELYTHFRSGDCVNELSAILQPFYEMNYELARQETMNKQAYLLAWIDLKGTPEFKGCCIFSERDPSVEGTGVWCEVAVGFGKTYEEACEDLKSRVKQFFPKLIPLTHRWE
jgi:hypothetical protein